MNKRIFYLIILLFIVVTIFNIKLFINTKKDILENYQYITKLEEKIEKINYLKQKYRFNYFLFNRLKKFCNTQYKNDINIILCKNLNSKQFNTIQNIIFKTNFKIKNFDIEKNSSAIIKAEIKK